MKLFAVPSRWGGLVAGCPKVPSIFASTHPETWMKNPDGSPFYFTFGPVCSVHHPATFEFYCEQFDQMLTQWPFAGIVWDELKALKRGDFSEAARAVMPDEAGMAWHIDQQALFFDRCGAYARTIKPDLYRAMFFVSTLEEPVIRRMSASAELEAFGCDGRPWSLAHDDPPDTNEEVAKSLLDHGPTFIEAARRNGKRPLMLMENHNMNEVCFDLMDRRIPDVIALGPEDLMYYYYPRNVSDPDRQMAIIAKHLKSLR
jgi:hypothetical protein